MGSTCCQRRPIKGVETQKCKTSYNFDSFVERPVGDGPWSARGVWQGGATGCRLLTSPPLGLRSGQAGSRAVPLPWLRAPDGSYGAGPSRGCDRRYRPGLRLSRVFHLHQACMDHPLEVARQRLQVDGKPHPTAPSHPQAPKPVGALQLGVCPLYPGPYGIPLAPLLGGLGPPPPLDVHSSPGPP